MGLKINQKGVVLTALVVTLPPLILITAFFLQLAVNSFGIARKDQFRTHAQFGADAGVDLGLKEINLNSSWGGTGGEVELHNNTDVKVTFQVTVTDVSATSKKLTSIGRTYRPASSSTVDSSVTLNVNLRPIASGDFSIVAGVGGLYLSNQAKVLGGDVFVNGNVHMQGSSQIGLQIAPVNLEVAHQTCPQPPTADYPRICNAAENGQPITIENPAHIYGTVRANNQTNGADMSDPGLQTPYCLQPVITSNCVATQPLPSHDRAAQKAAITVTRTGSDASCTSNGGSKTWAANTKIEGNVDITNSCEVTIEGDVWITGKFEMKNQAKLIVSNLLGTTRANLMIDGLAAKFNQSSTIVSNTQNTGLQVITYRSLASCSPDCADLIGADLYNSINEPTIELDQSAAAANTIFYARWSKVLVRNSGQIGALVGQTVELQNSGAVTFGSAITGGKSFWVIDSYRRAF